MLALRQPIALALYPFSDLGCSKNTTANLAHKLNTRAITFALYDDENRQFHQICVPFRSEKFVVIKYALDDVFVEETWGQVYRLCFEVTETSPWPDSNPQ